MNKQKNQALKLYKIILFFYPQNFKQHYEEQLLITFEDLYLENIQQNRLNFWLFILSDSLNSIISQHLINLKLIKLPFINNIFLKLITTFLTTFLTVSVIVWLFVLIYTGPLGQKNNMDNFMSKHHDTIENKVFGEAYTVASYCFSLPMPEQLECRKKAGKIIADNLPEEELRGNSQFGWPNDLVFIKQDGAAYYQLGWDGEIRNITPLINTKNLPQEQSTFSLLFRNDCNYFGNLHYSDCQIFTSLDLTNGNRGYIVRVSRSEEEYDLLTYIIFGPVLTVRAVPALFEGYISSYEEVIYIAYNTLNTTVAIVVTFIVLFKNIKPRRKNHF